MEEEDDEDDDEEDDDAAVTAGLFASPCPCPSLANVPSGFNPLR